MKIRVIVIAIVAIFLFVRFPARKILYSPLKNEKHITVFRPFQFRWENEYYIIPYKFEGIFGPADNYFKLTPIGEDQDMVVDWTPSDYELTIQLPLCEDIQKIFYKIDTTKFHIVKNCGSYDIDQAKPEQRNSKRFSYYKVRDWLP